MKLKYENFDNVNINDEINKIKKANLVELNVSTTDKAILFLMGILFAAGKKIKIINSNEIELNSSNKNFYKMAYVWEKLGDKDFSISINKSDNKELDIFIENVKRLGLKVKAISTNPQDNKIFLICPVRNATKEQLHNMENYIYAVKNAGYQIHAPHRDTVQQDIFGGYAICRQNAYAIATSKEVHIYYDKTSKGSMFDLGVAYYLNKPLQVLNSQNIKYSEDDFGDKLILNWQTNLDSLSTQSNEMVLQKKLK